jgi:hypothetical protein
MFSFCQVRANATETPFYHQTTAGGGVTTTTTTIASTKKGEKNKQWLSSRQGVRGARRVGGSRMATRPPRKTLHRNNNKIHDGKDERKIEHGYGCTYIS